MTDAANIFKALGEQTRMRIAMLLIGQELCVCDLTEVLRLPQSTISRHMTQLRQSGLVVDRRDGIWTHYRLADDKVVRDISQLLDNSFRNTQPYKGDQKRLAAHTIKSGCSPSPKKKRSRPQPAAAAI